MPCRLSSGVTVKSVQAGPTVSGNGHGTDASSVAASGSAGVLCACVPTDCSGGRRAFAVAVPVRAVPFCGPGRLWGRDHEISRSLRPLLKSRWRVCIMPTIRRGQLG